MHSTYVVCLERNFSYEPLSRSLEGVEEDLKRMKSEKYWKRILKKDSIQSKLLKRESEIRASYDAMMVRDQPERSIGF